MKYMHMENSSVVSISTLQCETGERSCVGAAGTDTKGTTISFLFVTITEAEETIPDVSDELRAVAFPGTGTCL